MNSRRLRAVVNNAKDTDAQLPKAQRQLQEAVSKYNELRRDEIELSSCKGTFGDRLMQNICKSCPEELNKNTCVSVYP